MRYPSGFARQALWAAAIFVCVVLAALYEGHGLAMDWVILSALVSWHINATRVERSGPNGK
jgi:hypothetical protein